MAPKKWTAEPPVDRRMMNLGRDGVRTGREAVDPVEPLDDEHFPQRPLHIQRPGVVPRNMNAELPPVTGLGQTSVPHMVFDVEVFVFSPIRMVELERKPL